jgi:hypothetical protein
LATYPTILGITTDEEIRERKKAFSGMLFSFLLFMADVYVLKNPALSEEREWRLVSLVPRGAHDDDVGMISEMDFRCVSERLVPYVAVPLIVDGGNPFAEIVIGPRNSTPVGFVKAFLEKAGLVGTTVWRSTASYR